jgi:hypothetical protein
MLGRFVMLENTSSLSAQVFLKEVKEMMDGGLIKHLSFFLFMTWLTG